MPNHIIPLPKSETGRRIKGSRRYSGGPGTTRQGQVERIGPKLDRAFSEILDRPDTDVDVAAEAMAPERVLVFEIIGELANFALAARRVGLYWLAERIAALEGVEDYATPSTPDDEEVEEDETDDDVSSDDDPPVDTGTQGRFYMAMPTLEAFGEMRRLWDLYSRDAPAPGGFSDWWTLFDRLHDLRPWGPKDRIPETTASYLEQQLSRHPQRSIRVEIDLWFYDESSVRRDVAATLETQIEAMKGRVLDRARITEIRHHGMLVLLPASTVRDLMEFAGPLATSQPVMTVRPQSMFSAFGDDEGLEDASGARPPAERDTRPSLAALLDGYPVQNHAMLRDRLDVIELDVQEDMAPLPQRYHGTAMSSLILHGDAESGTPPLSRILKVLPVLAPDANGVERPPRDKLIIKSIFAAVRLLKSGLQGAPPAGRDVIIINHSICDERNPFSGAMSAWSRALDYLAYEYKVLFIASAGNIRSSFPLAGFADVPALQGADPARRRTAILLALEAAKAMRGILPPAESVNALTVGAAHADAATTRAPASVVDPYGTLRMANLASALGLGFARSVKPDVLMDGGRQSASPSGDPMMIHAFDAAAFFGQKAASPDPNGASLRKTRRSSGTSNGAAMTTRSGLLIADALDETFSGRSTPWYRRPTAPCMLKTLIAHSSSWGDVGDALDAVLPPTGTRRAPRRRENISRYVGYGSTDMSRVLDGAENRATLLADDVIRVGQRHVYDIPLPDELSSRPEPRRITLTLSWLTPTKPGFANYRAVGLDLVGDDGSSAVWPGVARTKGQPPVWTSRRGTLLHAVYEGRSSVPFAPGSSFRINVQAASRSTRLTKLDVPYALAVTVEVLSDVGIDVFRSIETRLRPRVRTRR